MSDAFFYLSACDSLIGGGCFTSYFSFTGFAFFFNFSGFASGASATLG
jgi:hypothetical protein